MTELLNKKNLIKKRVENGYTVKTALYRGTKEDNHDSGNVEEIKVQNSEKSITMATPIWEGSEGHAKVWNQIEDIRKRVKNAAMLPDDWSTLTDLLRVDITRRRMNEADYTGIVGTEIVNDGFTKSITLDEFLEWGAIFETIYGNNDAIPLLEHKSGATGTVTMDLFAVGEKSSLQELIFSPLYEMEKVMRAVTRGYVALRNDRTVLGEMVKYTAATETGYTGGWDSGQKQAADTTSGATKEELLYNTLISAYKKLINLKDVQTDDLIDTPSVYLAIPKGASFAFNRAINGQLNLGGKGKPSNFEALNWIDAIIPYRGDTIYAGKKKKAYGGVASGYAYMFVPKVYNWTLTKRGLTREVGAGDMSNMFKEQSVFYGCQTEYSQEFFGYTAGLKSTGYGACIEITLPTL